MTDNECRCRIREASTARLRVLDDGPSSAVDVTYSVQGNTVVVRPSGDSRSDVLRSRRSALLEIDHGSVDAWKRWRIIVTGQCEPIGTNTNRPATSGTEHRPADGIELRIQFVEGRHGAPEALPPGIVVPQQRRPTA